MTQMNYLHFSVKVLKMLRIYNRKCSKAGKITDFLVRLLCNGLLACSSICMAVHIHHVGLFQYEVNAMSYAFFGSGLSVLYRTMYFWRNRNKCENFIPKINYLFKLTTKTLLEEKNIQHHVNLLDRLSFFWIVYMQMVCSAFLVLDYFLRPSERNLPIPMWIPYEWKLTPLYQMTYFLQISFMLTCAGLQASTDTFIITLILLTAKQFDLIGWELKNLLYTNLIKNGIPKETVLEFRKQFNELAEDEEIKDIDAREIFNKLDSEGFTEDMLTSCSELIAFHQSLLSICTDLKEFLSPLMLAYYAVLMLVTLFFNFAVLSWEGSSQGTSQDTSFLFIPLCITGYFDMWFPCYVANILTTQAEKFQADLYELPWYICDKKFQAAFKIINLNARVPVSLSVGYLADLNLKLFLWAARTLNSYSIMLYQLSQ